MSIYLKHMKEKQVPQTKKASKGQKKNNAGGYSFKLDNWSNLDRFLILGCEGGTYYVSEEKTTKKNVKWFEKCLKEDFKRTIDTIASISLSGRAIKNDPAIFLLGLAASHKDSDIVEYALSKVNEVCRIGTHLFQFVETVNEMRGWGRSLRDGVSNWYLSKTIDKLTYQVTKYKQRNGWSHRDVLRLAHPKPESAERNELFKYITAGDIGENAYLQAVEELKTATDKRRIELIKEFNLPREVLPTECLNSTKIWEALLEDMPMTAMIRNLGKMSSIGILKPLSKNEKLVKAALTNSDNLKRARIHPFSLLLAYKNYGMGRGFRGALSWDVNQSIVGALEDAYYLAFNYVEPSNKNFLFGIDVSGSMTWTINNTNISCAEASACLAMTSMRTEPNTYAFGFTNTFVDLGISPKDDLKSVYNKVQRSNFGCTDCAIPMLHATKNKLDVDVFVVLTDSETYAGRVHPHKALEEYRQIMGKSAKLIVVGMTSNRFSIADPEDPHQLDIAGFDANCPQVITEIAKL